MFFARSLVVGILLAPVAACAAHNRAPLGQPAGTDDAIVIEVDNSTPMNLRLYALHAGGTTPLGRVSAMTQQPVRVPGVVRGSLRLMAKPAVDRGRNSQHVTEPIAVLRGQRLSWRLQTSPGVSDIPRLSTVRVLASCMDPAAC